MVLNIFYEEPDGDRWFPYDRYPRRIIRRAVRGKPRPGGQMRVFLNLCAGLERIGVGFRINDYRHARKNPSELACIIGKHHVLDKVEWKNPILFGAAVFSHPFDDPNLLKRLPVKKILVPGQWMKQMWEPFWNGAIDVWPVGIDTDMWRPSPPEHKEIDVLLYDKVRWDHDTYNSVLIEPIRAVLAKRGRSFVEMRYGFYQEEEFHNALRRCRTMIFLCEHETQGIAYQQALSCGVPILAWDRGGFWKDPSYYPDKVVFEPVTSVPYWDERCGSRFYDFAEFECAWNGFWEQSKSNCFMPRNYILENLTLEKCAKNYCDLARQLS